MFWHVTKYSQVLLTHPWSLENGKEEDWQAIHRKIKRSQLDTWAEIIFLGIV